MIFVQSRYINFIGLWGEMCFTAMLPVNLDEYDFAL